DAEIAVRIAVQAHVDVIAPAGGPQPPPATFARVSRYRVPAREARPATGYWSPAGGGRRNYPRAASAPGSHAIAPRSRPRPAPRGGRGRPEGAGGGLGLRTAGPAAPPGHARR